MDVNLERQADRFLSLLKKGEIVCVCVKEQSGPSEDHSLTDPVNGVAEGSSNGD